MTLADGAVPQQDSLERRSPAALLIGTVVAIVIGLLVARSLSASLRRTAALAKSMSRGNLDVRIPVTGPREVEEVSATLNGLADALQRSGSAPSAPTRSVAGEPTDPADRIVVPVLAPDPRPGVAPTDEFAGGALVASDGLVPLAQEFPHPERDRRR